MKITTSKPAAGQFATPDVTPAQLLAAATAIGGQAVAWGWMTPGTSANLVSVAAIILPAVWAVVDSIIRHGRATGSADKATK